MRADIEVLMASLIQTDTRLQISAAPKAAQLVDTRTMAQRQHSLASKKTGQSGHSSLQYA